MLDLSKIRQSVRYEGGISRRLFLAYGAALAAVPYRDLTVNAQEKRPKFTANPFSLGVASGDPSPTGVVLWTRLAPQPQAEFGGMPAVPVEVAWDIADDDGMTKNLRSGVSTATPQLGHSVHVEVDGLAPDRWYFYRFRVGDAVSPVARTRTLPPRDSMPEKLRFAFASCQNFEQGLFTAYEHMAKDELDLVLHLGDYIYEYPQRPKAVRPHTGPTNAKIKTLEEYRARHAQYRADPLLQGMHARCPWVVTWDDHEFDNNYASDIHEKNEVDPVTFLEQRANAYQAYYEMMPLRRRSVPQGPNMTLYRTLPVGRLVSFQVLDTRQYRTDQPNGDKASDLNDEALNPRGTLLGAKQANWLKSALLQSTARWNVLAQQVMMGMVDIAEGPNQRYSMDQWPSAAYERMSLMKWITERRVSNPVVLTGDIHSNWVNDLRVDDRKVETPVVATEFVGTSISSGGNGLEKPKNLASLLAENPCVKFHNRERGYVRCTVTPDGWTSDYVVVPEVLKPGGAAVKRAAFVVEAGRPGAKPA